MHRPRDHDLSRQVLQVSKDADQRQPAGQELLALHIVSTDDDGWGSGDVAGRLVRVKGVHVGEDVQVKIIRREGRTSIGELIHLDAPRHGRAQPFCAHFSACGGCTAQHVIADQQLAAKQQQLLDLFAAQGVKVHRVAPAILGPVRSYRRRARLSARYTQKRQRLFLGFREAAGHVVADIDSCAVLVEPFGSEIANLRRVIEGTTLHAAVPQLEIAVGDGGKDERAAAMVVRHLLPPTAADLRALRRWCDQQGVVLWLQPGGAETAHTVDEQAPQLLSYVDFGLRMAFHPLDFIQVNAVINRQMIALCLAALPAGSKRVLDLFCGMGNLTLPVARQFDAVVGVEGNPTLVLRATANARDNGLKNARFVSADLHGSDVRRLTALGKFDAVILDPPRSGAGAVLAIIPTLAPRTIVYFSCNPVSLASDAHQLAAAGYRCAEIRLLDMFPNTAHSECCAVFTAD